MDICDSGTLVPWKDVRMSGRRRSFTPEYWVEAVHRVVDGNRRVAEGALELNLHENLLHKWVSQERRRMAAAGAAYRILVIASPAT